MSFSEKINALRLLVTYPIKCVKNKKITFALAANLTFIKRTSGSKTKCLQLKFEFSLLVLRNYGPRGPKIKSLQIKFEFYVLVP